MRQNFQKQNVVGLMAAIFLSSAAGKRLSASGVFTPSKTVSKASGVPSSGQPSYRPEQVAGSRECLRRVRQMSGIKLASIPRRTWQLVVDSETNQQSVVLV